MDALVQHFRTTVLEQRIPTKDDLEFRYKARIGPIISPEPEFGDVTQSAELFSIDPQKTLLMMCKEQVDAPIEEMQHHLMLEFHHAAHEIFAKILTSNKKGHRKEQKEFIGAVEFEQLSKRLMDGFINTVREYCSEKMTPKIIDVMDNFMTHANRSLVKEKERIATKLVDARDACEEYRKTHERAMDHIKAEAIRMTTNVTEDKYIGDISKLNQSREEADYVNRLLTKKVDHFTAEMGKKDAMVHDLQIKAQKAHKKVLQAQKEVHEIKSKQHHHIKEINDKWQRKVDMLQDQLQEHIDKALKNSHVKAEVKPLCIDSFTQTVEELALSLPYNNSVAKSKVESVEVESIPHVSEDVRNQSEKIENLEATADQLKADLAKADAIHQKEISHLQQLIEELQISNTQLCARIETQDLPSNEMASTDSLPGVPVESSPPLVQQEIISENTETTLTESEPFDNPKQSEITHIPASITENFTQTDRLARSEAGTQTDEVMNSGMNSLEESVGIPIEHDSINQLIPEHEFRGRSSFDVKNSSSISMESLDKVVSDFNKYDEEAKALVVEMTNKTGLFGPTQSKYNNEQDKVPSMTQHLNTAKFSSDARDQTVKVLGSEAIAEQFAERKSYDINLSFASAEMNDEDDANDAEASLVESVMSMDFRYPPQIEVDENTRDNAYVNSKNNASNAEYVELQRLFEKMNKDNDFQKYVIFSLEEQCKQQTAQIEALTSLMEQNELVSKLKLRERGILLVELSAHVNALRNQLLKGGANGSLSTMPPIRPISVSKSTNALPKLSDDIDLPETTSSPIALRSLRDNSQTMPVIDVRPATVLSQARTGTADRKSTPKQRQRMLASTPDGPLHNKPFTAPLYNVKQPYSDFESMTVAPVATSPVKQTNFLKVGGGNTMSKRPNMFEASAGAQGRLKNVEGVKIDLIKEENSFYSDSKNESMMEEAALSISWLGIDDAKQEEIANIRKEIVQKLTDAAKLKKKHMLATTKAAQMKGKGREIKLKSNSSIIPTI